MRSPPTRHSGSLKRPKLRVMLLTKLEFLCILYTYSFATLESPSSAISMLLKGAEVARHKRYPLFHCRRLELRRFCISQFGMEMGDSRAKEFVLTSTILLARTSQHLGENSPNLVEGRSGGACGGLNRKKRERDTVPVAIVRFCQHHHILCGCGRDNTGAVLGQTNVEIIVADVNIIATDF